MSRGLDRTTPCRSPQPRRGSAPRRATDRRRSPVALAQAGTARASHRQPFGRLPQPRRQCPHRSDPALRGSLRALRHDAQSQQSRHRPRERRAIESAHGHIKGALREALLLRGSAAFDYLAAYRRLVGELVSRKNRRNAAASCSRRVATICSSANLDRFDIPDHEAVDGPDRASALLRPGRSTDLGLDRSHFVRLRVPGSQFVSSGPAAPAESRPEFCSIKRYGRRPVDSSTFWLRRKRFDGHSASSATLLHGVSI